jgi:hypothetical protein
MALGLGLMVAALGVPAFAGVPPVPEIDGGSSMVTAIALLSGAVLLVTNRARRQ